MSSTPTAALETLLDLSPLHVVGKSRAISGAYKLKIILVEQRTAILKELDIFSMMPDGINKTNAKRTFAIFILARGD